VGTEFIAQIFFFFTKMSRRFCFACANLLKGGTGSLFRNRAGFFYRVFKFTAQVPVKVLTHGMLPVTAGADADGDCTNFITLFPFIVF
jgi:hypothetical protein